MYEFKSDQIFEITGRGKVYCIPANNLPKPFYNAAQMLGVEVKINDEVGIVKGIEWDLLEGSPTNPSTSAFGILI